MIELEGVLEEVPELVDPVMVAAFEGWNDAGDAASAAIGHLEHEWKGEVLTALDAEEYYDFQVNRPQMWLDGGVRKITWPTTRLAIVRVDDIDGKGRRRDLVLVRGIEPSMRWRSFCNEILSYAHELGVEMVVVLGALLGDTPHTRPVPVNGVTSDPDLARTLDLEESRYEGPTGIVGILQEACTHAGVPAVSLWASVPHYVSQPPNPKATLALLNRLEDLLGIRVPLGDLAEDARAWQIGVDQLAAEDSEVAEYVQSLEEARDTAELPEASGEAIAKEFERYLRRRDGGQGPATGPYLRDPGSERARERRRPAKGRDERQEGPEGGAAPEQEPGEASASEEKSGDGGAAESAPRGGTDTGTGAGAGAEAADTGAAGEGADSGDGNDSNEADARDGDRPDTDGEAPAPEGDSPDSSEDSQDRGSDRNE